MPFLVLAGGGSGDSGGRGVHELTVDARGHLMVSYTDGTTQDLGTVMGPQGPAVVVGLSTADDPSGNLILDPETGDVLKTTGG